MWLARLADEQLPDPPQRHDQAREISVEFERFLRSGPVAAPAASEKTSPAVKHSDDFTADELLARGLNPNLLPSRFRKEHTA